MEMRAGTPSRTEASACCAAAYTHPAVRWLLGGQLHPGGVALSRRTLMLARVRPCDWRLDVAAGVGDSALLAARELAAEVVGVDYDEHAVAAARDAAQAAGLSQRVSFLRGDASAMPVADASFDAVLCECSLSTFADKLRVATELRRALAPGGRVALSDVVVERPLLTSLHGAITTIACIEDALSSAADSLSQLRARRATDPDRRLHERRRLPSPPLARRRGTSELSRRDRRERRRG